MQPLKKARENSSKNLYEREIVPMLKPRDGNIHVLLINSFSKWINQVFSAEKKYTTQIEEIISAMQYEGYEIIDIKFNSLKNQGVFNNMEGFHTLIMYK